MRGENKDMRKEFREEKREMREGYEDMTNEERMEAKKELRESGKETRKEVRKNRKHFKEEHRGIVKKVIMNVDHSRLEKALEKIDKSLEVVQDEEVIDLLEGIKEVIEETLAE